MLRCWIWRKSSTWSFLCYYYYYLPLGWSQDRLCFISMVSQKSGSTVRSSTFYAKLQSVASLVFCNKTTQFAPMLPLSKASTIPHLHVSLFVVPSSYFAFLFLWFHMFPTWLNPNLQVALVCIVEGAPYVYCVLWIKQSLISLDFRLLQEYCWLNYLPSFITWEREMFVSCTVLTSKLERCAMKNCVSLLHIYLLGAGSASQHIRRRVAWAIDQRVRLTTNLATPMDISNYHIS